MSGEILSIEEQVRKLPVSMDVLNAAAMAYYEDYAQVVEAQDLKKDGEAFERIRELMQTLCKYGYLRVNTHAQVSMLIEMDPSKRRGL